MTKLRIGHCVYFDSVRDSSDILPLLVCLSYAIERNHPVNFYLNSLLGQEGPSGGDPGWSIHWIDRAEDALFPEDWKRCMKYVPEHEAGCFEAWTEKNISNLDPYCAYYPKNVVFHHTLVALGNFKEAHPERTDEIDEVTKWFSSSIHLGNP